MRAYLRKSESQQVVLFRTRPYTGRVVRDVQEWDGRVVGWVRLFSGDWVVQREGEHWAVLESVSVKEIIR